MIANIAPGLTDAPEPIPFTVIVTPGGGGGGGALGVTILTVKVADPLNLVLDPMARILTE